MSKKQAAPQIAGADKLAFKQISLRDKLQSLDRVQREAVANYFNMYNAAAWIFNEVLDQNAKEYVDEAVIYARELNELDQTPLDPSTIEKFVDDYNLRVDASSEGITPKDELIHGKESL